MNKLLNILCKDTESLYTELEKKVKLWPLLYDGQNVSLFQFQPHVAEDYPEKQNTGMIFYSRCSKDGWNNSYFISFCEQVSKKAFSSVTWSGIIKAFPSSGLNPSEKLYKVQKESLIQILRKEIEVLSPSICVLPIGDSIKSGYEKLVLDAFSEFKKGKTIQYGTYNRMDKTYPLTATAYSLDRKLFIITDVPNHKSYMAEHIATIQELIDNYELLESSLARDNKQD